MAMSRIHTNTVSLSKEKNCWSWTAIYFFSFFSFFSLFIRIIFNQFLDVFSSSVCFLYAFFFGLLQKFDFRQVVIWLRLFPGCSSKRFLLFCRDEAWDIPPNGPWISIVHHKSTWETLGNRLLSRKLPEDLDGRRLAVKFMFSRAAS